MHKINIDDDNKDLAYFDYESATAETFNSMEPFEYLMAIRDKDELLFEMELNKMTNCAKPLGTPNFKKVFNAYLNKLNRIGMNGQTFTAFTDQEEELATTWIADDKGVRKTINFQEIWACRHPITITRRIYGIDNGLEKIEIAFKAGRKWRTGIFEKSVIASAQKIIALADTGVSVTSENAKHLVAYLQELESMNYNSIETIEATSRLGWVRGDEFMPYSENVSFDGEVAFSRLFSSVHAEGSEAEWQSIISIVRRKHIAGRIVMATAALSPLLSRISSLPSFVHVWASMSSTGKTILAMAAASFWGDPELGAYTQSFNATTVAMERIAETLNSCPFVLDELQLAKGNRGIQFDVYKLAQGLGKGRGTKTGGIDRTPTWCNTIITTGETPIVSESDGQGAYARVLEIQLNEILFDFQTGNRIAKTIKSNFGWGGQKMIQAILEIGKEEIQERFDRYAKELAQEGNIQDKQLMLGAGLLLADEIADEYIFNDDLGRLTIDELRPMLLTRTQTSVDQRAYEFIQDWIASNSERFASGAQEQYGMIEPDCVYIVRSIFNKVMEDEGFNPKSVLASFASAERIHTSMDGTKVRTDVQKRMNGNKARFVALKIEEEGPVYAEQTELPFD